tara:strand:- start:31066 stop:31635 length:570 start_codon:yes stop_codon:yes gene_type:complete
MGDSYNEHQQNRRNFNPTEARGRGGFQHGRGPGNRDGGGFRIRLSDNELRYARSIQEAFNLRSTIAVLGFAVRTIGEMLEQGKLDELMNQYNEQRSKQNIKRNQENRFENRRDNSSSNSNKPNPFARPSKPEQTNPDQADNETEGESENSNLGEKENDQSSTKIADDSIPISASDSSLVEQENVQNLSP